MIISYSFVKGVFFLFEQQAFARHSAGIVAYVKPQEVQQPVNNL